MASSPQLQKLIVDQFKIVSAATVFHHDHNLAAAGLRTVGGRGHNAAKMTAQDAAALVLVVTASPLVKDTVTIFRRYSSLKPMEAYTPEQLDRAPAEVAEVCRADHTFFDVLVAFIESSISGSFEALTTKAFKGGTKTVAMSYAQSTELRFIAPHPMVDVDLRFEGGGFAKRYVADGPSLHKLDRKSVAEFARLAEERFGPAGDLTELRIFTGRTLLAIGKLLRS